MPKRDVKIENVELFKKRLRELCARKNRTKTELAKSINISKQRLNVYIKEGAIPYAILRQICLKLDCVIPYLLGKSKHQFWGFEDGNKTINPITTEYLLIEEKIVLRLIKDKPQEMSKVIDFIDTADANQLTQLLRFIDSFDKNTDTPELRTIFLQLHKQVLSNVFMETYAKEIMLRSNIDFKKFPKKALFWCFKSSFEKHYENFLKDFQKNFLE